MRNWWRCRLGWHRWEHNIDQDGQVYLSCALCNRDRVTPPQRHPRPL